MSKKKQKPSKPGEFHAAYGVQSQTVTGTAVAVKTAEVSRKLDEIIDLLHVLVENTKKPERTSGPRYEINVSSIDEARAAAQRQHDWESVRGRKRGAAEEVEDYHGIATTEPYSLPVRIHR